MWPVEAPHDGACEGGAHLPPLNPQLRDPPGKQGRGWDFNQRGWGWASAQSSEFFIEKKIDFITFLTFKI